MEPININSQHSLINIENYKKTLDVSVCEIIDKYFSLTNEYLNFVIDNVSFKNSIYTNFIIERGFETITHVFVLLLHVSKNLDLSYYHSQKAFYFYVEFIGQITEDKHTFLQLSSRDATMFVYRKTIFEINNEVYKNSKLSTSENIEKSEILNLIILTMKCIISFVLEKDRKTAKYIGSICSAILKLNFKKENMEIIQTFICSLKYDISTEKYFELINAFVYKYSKLKPENQYNVSVKTIKEKFLDQSFSQKILDPSGVFIKWVLH